MTDMNKHPSAEEVSAFIDRELSPDQSSGIQQHLANCHPCSLRVLSGLQIKEATAQAGKRFEPSADTLARLTAQLRPKQAHLPERPRRLLVLRTVAWSAIAAALLVTIGVFAWQRTRNANTLAAELLDQHLAVLSPAAPPEVVSTDRHTVKPWFQGKLPFTFNLPDATAMPPDTVLKGADLTYVEGKPAALLLFAIRKHEVSVFVTHRSGPLELLPSSIRSGFAIRPAKTHDLCLIGVSDVEPKDLDQLVSALVRAQ